MKLQSLDMVRRAMVQVEVSFLELSLLLLVLLNALTVLFRYVLHRPIGGAFDVMVLLGVAIYWVGAGTVERHDGHLGVSFVVDRCSPFWRRIAARVRLLVVCAFLLATIYASTEFVASQYHSNVVSGALNMPLWIFSMSIPVGCLLMLVRVLRPSRSSGAQNDIAKDAITSAAQHGTGRGPLL